MSSIKAGPAVHTPGVAAIRDAHGEVNTNLARADLTAVACVAMLYGELQAVTNISSVPTSVYPYLIAAVVLAAGVLGGAGWALWPRRLGRKVVMPGSWVHALTKADGIETLADYDGYTAEEIIAAQVHALAPIARRKWLAARVALMFLAPQQIVLITGAIVGLSS